MSTIIVPLTRDKVALIDEEDAERVLVHSWCAYLFRPSSNRPRWYAMRGVRKPRARLIYLHRFILGEPPGVFIDHENGDGLDCRRANLRETTRTGNAQNTGIPIHNTSGFKGVSWCRLTGKWAAQIRIDGKQTNLGRFETREEAAIVYDEVARIHHGKLGRYNFPLPGERGVR